MFDKKRVHFIGIGGIGMSGIAEVLFNMGFVISGSDISENANIHRLKKLGINIFKNHEASNIQDADVVVYSSAVVASNPELVAAVSLQKPLFKRAEMLSEIMRLKKGIAVAGTHGKTTTSGFVATLLAELNQYPTHIIGGMIENLGGHARVGKGDWLVVEADESDGTFLLYNPIVSLVTNIDDDHMEYYKNWEGLKDAFISFTNKVPFYGACIINIDDPKIQEIQSFIKRPVLTYAVTRKADYQAKNIKLKANESSFDLYYKDVFQTTFSINLMGEHNISNALGAIVACHFVGMDLVAMSEVIGKFTGAKRRFDILFKNKNQEIIDDYAHHPTEIKATLKAAKETRNRELVVVFEPHRYSRLKNSWKDFLHCFNFADKVYIGPIYSAGENPDPDLNQDRLARDINDLHPHLAEVISDLDHLENIFKKHKEATILGLGAGSISAKFRQAVEKWGK